VGQRTDALVRIKGRRNFFGPDQGIDQGEQDILWLPTDGVKGNQACTCFATCFSRLIGFGIQIRCVDRTDGHVALCRGGRDLTPRDVGMGIAL